MTPREILLVRHPETQANAAGLHVARADSAYSETGRVQAREIPEAIRAWEPGVVVSSPQRRALAPALAVRVRPIRIDADLAEFDVGLVEGMSHEEALARGLIDESDWSGPDARPYAGGERVGAFRERVAKAWRRLLAEDAERVAVLSHRGVIATLVVGALGLPVEAVWRLRVEPASGVRLELEGSLAMLVGLGPLPKTLPGGTMRSNP